MIFLTSIYLHTSTRVLHTPPTINTTINTTSPSPHKTTPPPSLSHARLFPRTGPPDVLEVLKPLFFSFLLLSRQHRHVAKNLVHLPRAQVLASNVERTGLTCRTNEASIPRLLVSTSCLRYRKTEPEKEVRMLVRHVRTFLRRVKSLTVLHAALQDPNGEVEAFDQSQCHYP